MLHERGYDKRLIGQPTKEVFLPAIRYRIDAINDLIHPARIALGETARIYWRVPHNYHAITSFIVVTYTIINSAAHNVTYDMFAGGCNEAVNAHSESQLVSPNYTANVYLCQELVTVLTTILPQLTVGDIIRLRILNGDLNELYVVGADVRYI